MVNAFNFIFLRMDFGQVETFSLVMLFNCPITFTTLKRKELSNLLLISMQSLKIFVWQVIIPCMEVEKIWLQILI
jgi:hypothetical protein